MPFRLICKVGRRDAIDLKYAASPDDPLSFILTVTPQHVAHATSKSVIRRSDMRDYIEANADRLKAIAENCRARGVISEVLQ
jgi:hypothetical protein